MQNEATLLHVLGLVIAVMFLQAFINLASSIQDLFTKLVVGKVLYTWTRERGTIDDTMTPDGGAATGVYTRVKTPDGKYRTRQVAGEEADFEDEEFKEETDDYSEEEPKWKKLYQHLRH